MASNEPEAEVRAELRQVEEELAELRPQVAQLREQIGERWDAPADPADVATELTAVEEQDAIIASLEARREELLERLGQRGQSGDPGGT